MIVFECDVNILEQFGSILSGQTGEGDWQVQFGFVPPKLGHGKASGRKIPFVVICAPSGVRACYGPAYEEDDRDSCDFRPETFEEVLSISGDRSVLSEAFSRAVALAQGGDVMRIEKDDKVELYWIFPIPSTRVRLSYGVGTSLSID